MGEEIKYTAAVITVSDKCSRGEREDTSGPAVKEMLEADGWTVEYCNIVPDEFELIKGELVNCSYELDVCLAVTTGGTGLLPPGRDPGGDGGRHKPRRARHSGGDARGQRADNAPGDALPRDSGPARAHAHHQPARQRQGRDGKPFGGAAALKHGLDMLRGLKAECAVHTHKEQ